VLIPTQPAGAFHYDLLTQEPPIVERLELFNNSRNAASYRDNALSARIDGEVRMEAATGSAPVLVGTFSATWTDPVDTCSDDTSCPPGSISASFRSVIDF
jgi:hypothetical protein